MSYFKPEEVAKLVELRSRYFLCVVRFAENAGDFDKILPCLWDMEGVMREWTILLSPHLLQMKEVFAADNYPLGQMIAGVALAKNTNKLLKECSDILFDKHTNAAVKVLLGGLDVSGISVAVNYRSDYNSKPTVMKNGIFCKGVVENKESVVCTIGFKDGTQIKWGKEGHEHANGRQLFEQKMAQLVDQQNHNAPKM